MKFNEFINKVLFYVSVPKCPACKKRLLISDKALCSECKTEYTNLLEFNCSICSKPYYECECSNKFLKSHYVHKVYKVFRYFPADEPPTNMLIFSLKRENRKDVFEFLKSELKKSLLNKNVSFDNTIITNVPRRRASVRKYGYDHAKVLAKSLSKDFGIEYLNLLVSKVKKDQKKTHDKEERKKNAEFDYKRRARDISGKNVIIVDDVITTGASIGACATLMHGLGAKKVTALTLGIAYNDEYVPFNTQK